MKTLMQSRILHMGKMKKYLEERKQGASDPEMTTLKEDDGTEDDTDRETASFFKTHS